MGEINTPKQTHSFIVLIIIVVTVLFYMCCCCTSFRHVLGWNGSPGQKTVHLSSKQSVCNVNTILSQETTQWKNIFQQNSTHLAHLLHLLPNGVPCAFLVAASPFQLQFTNRVSRQAQMVEEFTAQNLTLTSHVHEWALACMTERRGRTACSACDTDMSEMHYTHYTESESALLARFA